MTDILSHKLEQLKSLQHISVNKTLNACVANIISRIEHIPTFTNDQLNAFVDIISNLYSMILSIHVDDPVEDANSNAIKRLELQVDQLVNENKQMKNAVEDLKTEIKELQTSKINDYILTRLIEAVQDVNSKFELEKTFKQPVKSKISLLRRDRVGMAHYILDKDDSQSVVDYKLKSILNQVEHISDNVKTRFETRYGKDLLVSLKTFLENLSFDSIDPLSDEDKELADIWWIPL